MIKCPNCESTLKYCSNEPLSTTIKTKEGLKEVIIEHLSYSRCDKCNEVYFNPEQAENYEKRVLEKQEEGL